MRNLCPNDHEANRNDGFANEIINLDGKIVRVDIKTNDFNCSCQIVAFYNVIFQLIH